MLDENSVGLSIEQDYQYTWRDIALYNLSVGAEQNTLNYVYEKSLKAIPTFGTIPCTATFGTTPYTEQPVMPTSKVEGMPPGGILHMDHKLIIERAIPTSGTLHIEKKIVNVYDRGEKGAKIMVEVVAKNENNEVVARNILGYLKKNCGGFGGHRPPASDIVIPDTQPDTILEESYPLNAALLYRLTGDTYPLHVDPVLAQKSGFERPIVHGLCSLGYACRMLIAYLFPEEPERMKSIECQFRSIAMPGDTFRIHVWKCGDQEALFRMVNKDTLKPILDFGRICWK